MILAVDVHYQDNAAFIAGVLFERWSSEHSYAEYSSFLDKVESYKSGSFYKRELPCILKLLEQHQLQPDAIVIDGYVYLDELGKAGLGKHLYDALGQQTEIIGVAKNAIAGISENHALLRGVSRNPLYITSTGDLEDAKKNISCMDGKYRIPVRLKRVDLLCREDARN